MEVSAIHSKPADIVHDPSSPVFVVDDTLCIPTVFIAYTGEALDYKTPLIRSIEALNKAAKDVCHYFNPDVKKVVAYLGWEQEYFLVDEGLYAARPDLLLTGRTLMGHEASKNSSWKTIISVLSLPVWLFHERSGNSGFGIGYSGQDTSQ